MEAGVLFSPKPSKNKVFCSTFVCNSKASKKPELSIHRFSEAGKIKVKFVNKLVMSEMIDRRILWGRIWRMGEEETSNMRVYLFHFVKEDYTRFTQPSKRLAIRIYVESVGFIILKFVN